MTKWYLVREIRRQERPVPAVDIGGTNIVMAIAEQDVSQE